MEEESSNYLQNIADRMIAYDGIREYVSEFAAEKEIDDEDLALSLLIVGFLWEAKKRDEVLREEDLNLLLGVEEDDEYTYGDSDHNLRYYLDDDQGDLELDELLDLTYYDFLNYNEDDDLDFDDEEID